MIAVLDSDFIIDFFKNKESAVKKMESLESGNAMLFTTVFNYHEVIKGFIKAQINGKEAFAELFFSSIGVLPYGRQEAKKAAQIEAELESRGEKISAFDTLIAAIAICRGAVLITRNTRHFSRIKGLKTESW